MPAPTTRGEPISWRISAGCWAGWTGSPYVEGIYWTALADGGVGPAIANRGTMGTVRESDGSMSIPLAFTTDYICGAELLSGSREWALALIPWEGDWQAAALHRQALEFAFPFVAVPGRQAEASPDFLRLDAPGLFLTAFYVDGGQGYVRLFNATAQDQAVEWKPREPPMVSAVDLRHRALPSSASMRLCGWQFQTYRVW